MKLKFIIDKDYDKVFVGKNEKTLQYIDEQYKSFLKFLELTTELYQKSWDEIGDDFSDYIEKTTGYKWFYDTYECYICNSQWNLELGRRSKNYSRVERKPLLYAKNYSS